MISKIFNFFRNYPAERLAKAARLWAVLFCPVGAILAVISMVKYGTDVSPEARQGRLYCIKTIALAWAEWKFTILWCASILFLIGRYICRFVLSPEQYTKLKASVQGLLTAWLSKLGLIRRGPSKKE